MVLTDARRATRADASGSLVLLADQDRSRWDHAAIERGRAMVIESLRGGRPGRFVLQACIAAVHAEAPTYADTDWPQIIKLYDLLLLSWPSPVVGLNRAVAVSMASGPEAGLAAIDELDTEPLASYLYLPATRADLLRQLGRRAEAAAEYRAAIALTDNATERVFLQRRLAEVTT
jgi:RNA polymerase sigma-70 factor (ECF subfamily)